MTLEEAKEKIFAELISCRLSTYMSLYTPDEGVITISNIMNLIEGLTKYRARQALKTLINEGLVCYTSQGCPAIESGGEYCELVAEARPPINGYTLTKKGRESAQYKKAYADWEKSMEEWANGYEEEDV